ncbi:MAG: DUF5615 family PIN-like protein [Candidatus Sumerlaeaceae bacterium]
MDECTRKAVLDSLEAAGYKLQPWQSVFQAGTVDEQVLASATSNDWILLTEDKGFGDLVFNRRIPAAGVILLRSAVTSEEVDALSTTLIEALQSDSELFYHHFTVVEPGRLRRRPLPGTFGKRIKE